MSTETTRGLRTRDRPEAQTKNERVTARIVRESDGTTRKEYSAGGRSYGSLDALKQALAGRP